MKKIKRLNVIYTPLNVSVSILQNGGSLTQTHCAETSEYIPDRTLTPLVLTPVVYVQDPDSIMENGRASLTGVAWYALPEDIAKGLTKETYLAAELSQYLITDATDGYVLEKDGSLRVEKNVPYLSPVVLVFTANVPDLRSGKIIKVQDSIVLSTTSLAVSATLTLDKPASWGFNPLEDEGVRTIRANLLFGGAVPDSGKVKTAYWWYHASSGSAEILISEDEALFYESGQNTDSLVIDPEYLDEERIICKAEYALPGETLPPAPTANCLTAETVISRRYPAYDFENYVHGGVEVSPVAGHVKNECVVTVGQKVLDSPSRYFTVIWSIKDAVFGAEWRVIGYGDSIMIPTSEIDQGADIGLELEEFDALGAMSDDEGNELTDDEGNLLTF